MGKSPMTLMASGLVGFGLNTEIKEPLLARYIILFDSDSEVL